MNISDEAVESVAKAIYERHGAKYYNPAGDWGDLEERFRTAWFEDARQALAAATPYLMSVAWERGRENGYHHRPNPYKETK